jgi:hypothetical protein
MITIDAQWAQHGSLQGHEPPHLIACSTGELRARNFEDALGRFSPDAGKEAAQVSVSYLTPAGLPTAGYLALAIHRRANPAGDGRAAGCTSYFCLPYAPLAMEAITYQAMHQALDLIRLPERDGPPVRVAISPSTPAISATDGRAMQAAALLLTNRPVCVVGADNTPMTERLAFIDTVMSLLPYGLRSRMTAATWTSRARQDHKFRLFFSDAPRNSDPRDHLLNWEGAEDRAIRLDDDWAYEYLTWLRDKVSQPIARLAELTAPVQFRRDKIMSVLDEIGVIGLDQAQNYSVTRQDALPKPVPRTEQGRERILRECADRVQAGDQSKVRSDISLLEKMAANRVDDAERARYQEILREGGLLEHHEKLGRHESRLHEQLLRVAFPVPFSYPAYCLVEECLKLRRPHRGLLQAIENCGMADQVTTAIVSWHLWNEGGKRQGRNKRETPAQRLLKWGETGRVDVADLIGLLGTERIHPDHAMIVCDVMLEYLGTITEGADRLAIRRALFHNRYLAHAPHAIGCRPLKAQVDALSWLLRAAYPDQLDRQDIVEILGDTKPTPALFAAVLLWLRRPTLDSGLTWRAFAHGLMSGMALVPEARSHILSVLPPLSTGPVGETGP